LTASRGQKNGYLLAGISLGLSFLARQSPLPLLAPIYLYFLLVHLSLDNSRERKSHFRNILMFHAGMIGVIAIFFLCLFKGSVFKDWINQNFMIGSFYKKYLTPNHIYENFIKGLFFQPKDKRLLLYSIVFFDSLIIFTKAFLQVPRKTKEIQQQFPERDSLLFLFSSVTLFGYLQSLHLYDLFRLQSVVGRQYLVTVPKLISSSCLVPQVR
jgi:hypothetical protein